LLFAAVGTNAAGVDYHAIGQALMPMA